MDLAPRQAGRRVSALVAVALLATVIPAAAQVEGTIRGEVRAAHGAGLGGVTIALAALPGRESVETTTDAAGRFSFTPVRPCEYLLTASHDGFAPRTARFVLEPREVRTLVLALELRPVQLSVDVTGQLVRSESPRSPSSTVIGGARIEALPPGQRASIPDVLLTAAPGVIRADNDFVHVRGHEIGLSLLINGVSFWENPLAGHSAGIDPEVVDTANVMTGGFSAEYGNRFGGVVDIVTKSGFTLRDRGAVILTAGEPGTGHVAGELGGRGRDLGYYAFGSLRRTDRFQNPPAAASLHNSGRRGHVFAEIDWSPGGSSLLRGVVMGDAASFDVPKTPLDEELRPLADAAQRTRQQTAILGWTRASSHVAVAASVYQRRSRSHLVPAGDPRSAHARMDRRLSTLGGKADLTRFSGRHTIKAGVDLVRLAPEEELFYDSSGYAAFAETVGAPRLHFRAPVVFSGRHRGGQVSGYVQDSMRLADRVTVDAGVRVDRHDLVTAATHPSPRVNLALEAGGGAVVHASYNHFFEPPAIEGVLSTSAGLTSRIEEIGVPLPPLRPATGDQFELGVAAPVGPARAGVTGYHRTAANAVHTTVWPDTHIYSHAGFDRVRARGLEARLDAPVLGRTGVGGYVNYGLGRIEYRNPVTGGFITEADHVTSAATFLAPMDQTHTMTAGLTWTHPRSGAWLGGSAEYGSGTPTSHEEGEEEELESESAHGMSRLPGHFTASVSAGIDLLRNARQRSRLSVRLDVENVTNTVYLIAREESQFGPALFSIPRLVSVTARLRF